jgi:acyl-coenzyme A thioesterase PaaI-like protein
MMAWPVQREGRYKAKLFKFGFNLSPMYRRSTAKIIFASEDLLTVTIKLPISYKNKNYMGSIFGGSMFSAVDPIPMVQLINILDNEYVVWDKSAEISFKSPAREHLYAEFTYSESEVEEIRKRVVENGETQIVKITRLTNKDSRKTFCEVKKTIYVASISHYKKKRQQRNINI